MTKFPFTRIFFVSYFFQFVDGYSFFLFFFWYYIFVLHRNCSPSQSVYNCNRSISLLMDHNNVKASTKKKDLYIFDGTLDYIVQKCLAANFTKKKKIGKISGSRFSLNTFFYIYVPAITGRRTRRRKNCWNRWIAIWFLTFLFIEICRLFFHILSVLPCSTDCHHRLSLSSE